MSDQRGIPAGSVISRVYYAIPESYTIGRTFHGWNEVVVAAQDKADELRSRLTVSLAGFANPETVEATVNSQVRIDLRWVIQVPDGTEIDMVVQSFHDVGKLRTFEDSTD